MGIQLREIGSWVRNRKFAASLLVAATLSIGILIGTVISGRVNATHSILPSGATLLDLPNPISLSNAFGAIVERDEPTVVNISTTQVIDRKGQPQDRGGKVRSIRFMIFSTGFSTLPTKDRRPSEAWARASSSTKRDSSSRIITSSNRPPRFKCS